MKSRRVAEKSKHACNRCRATKLRCLVDTVAQHGKCRRCYEGDEECVFDDMASRSRRERSDTRLRLLEQEVKTLKMRFESFAKNANEVRNTESAPALNVLGSDSDNETNNPNSSSQIADSTMVYLFDNLGCEEGFVEGHRLLPYAEAESLFNIFVAQSLPQYPIMAFEDDPKLHILCRSKPLQAFAMITAASRAVNPTLFRQLHLRLSRVLAERIVVRGEKNLELLAALLIAEVWYDPPDDLDRLNFYSWLQIAANLAQQLGLWWDRDTTDAITNCQANLEQRERWRLAIATYLSLSTVSVSLKRPSSISLSDSAREALAKYVITATHINDKKLAAWITLQLIAEEIEAVRLKQRLQTNLAYDLSAKLDDLHSRLTLYEQMTVLSDSLQVHYFYVRSKLMELYVHQFAEYVSGQRNSGPFVDDSIRTSHERSIVRLVQTAHDIIRIVAQMQVDEYLNSPTITTVRALYAIRTLHLLHSKSVRPSNTGPSISLHIFVDLESQLVKLGSFLAKVQKDLEHRIPEMALHAIQSMNGGNSQHHTDSTESVGMHTRVLASDLEIVTSPTLVAEGENVSGHMLQTGSDQNQAMTQSNLENIDRHQSSTDVITPTSSFPIDFSYPDAPFWDLLAPQNETSLDGIWKESYF